MPEGLEYDCLIIGAGPAGLACAIRLKQLCIEHQQDLRVAVLEKGAEVGAHSLSGAVLEPVALNELLPNWRQLSPPPATPVSDDRFYLLTRRHALRLPIFGPLANHGNFIVSLGRWCRWLATQAEQLGVDILPGFAASQLIEHSGRIVGVRTGDVGLQSDGSPGPRYEPGVELHAKLTLLAEGCRGQLSEQVIKRFNLRAASSEQTYGIGIKELWKIPQVNHHAGRVIHTVGWPLDNQTYGGAFVYHLDQQQVALGLVVGLDYTNPYLDPFQECQRFKTHPLLRKLLAGGERIGYGARALNEGGWQAIPQCEFPGGALIGCSAGLVNVAKIKGNHCAMKAGMLAAAHCFESIKSDSKPSLEGYTSELKQSWVGQELYRARNIRPAFHHHLWLGLAYTAFDQVILRGQAPWTFRHRVDHEQLHPAQACQPPHYPKPDGKLTFDKLSSLSLSGVGHRESQPCHLQLKHADKAIAVNWQIYHSPEQYYCPANVYEILQPEDPNQPAALQINFANCIHCKTCDIKDPTQNIIWTAPEGGEGPKYSGM